MSGSPGHRPFGEATPEPTEGYDHQAQPATNNIENTATLEEGIDKHRGLVLHSLVE
jgi:hypothetical protein